MTSAEHTHEPRWAVVGGGVLGMTLALRLRQQGLAVTLIEAAPTLGGLAQAWQLGPVEWDKYYHVILMSDLATRGLLTELGLAEDLRFVETKTGFYTDGQLHSMSNSVEFLKFPPLGLIDKLRLGATIFLGSRIQDGKKLEEIPVADWLRRYSGERTFDKIWLPLLRAKLGEAYRETSASFIWATIARMYAARRSGLKKEMFGYLRGGYGRLLGTLEARLRETGVEIQTGTSVEEIAPANGQVRVNGRVFDEVIVTSPAQTAARICKGLSADEYSRLRGIQYLGVMCASLLLEKPLDRFYVTNLTDSWVPFTAVIESTNIIDRAEVGGNTLVYLPKYLKPSDSMFDEPDSVIEDRFLAALEKIYPHFRRSHVKAFQIARARLVFALPSLSYSDRLPPVETSVRGLHILNSAHIVNGTLNVNETIQLAERFLPTLTASATSRVREAVQA